MKATVLATAASLLFSTGACEKEGNSFHPAISWTPPTDNSDFQHWWMAESTVALTDKMVLVPNGHNQLGFLANKFTFEATSWEMSIDFEVDYTSDMAATAKAAWQIYLLEHVPDAIAREQYDSFGLSLLGDQLRGLQLSFTQLPKMRRSSSGGVGMTAQKEHNPETMVTLTSHSQDSGADTGREQPFCHVSFTRAIWRIESDSDRGETLVEFKRFGESTWNKCFSIDRPIDYPVHTYLSAGDSQKNRRAVFIRSIKFYDNEQVIEGEEETIDTEAYRNYKGNAMDLLLMGNVDGVLLKSEKAGRDAYNDKMLKYNSRYAQLVGKQKSNVDGIASVYQSLPHLELIDTIRRDIHSLNEKQLSFVSHFEDFRRQIQTVTNNFLELRGSKGGDITDENFMREENTVVMSVDRSENLLQQIRRQMADEDKVSQAIRKSHLFQQEDEDKSSPQLQAKLNVLKDQHLRSLRNVLEKKARSVTKKSIRGTDVPTEYIALGAFVFIALVGLLVGYQVKKASVTLPMVNKNRLD